MNKPARGRLWNAAAATWGLSEELIVEDYVPILLIAMLDEVSGERVHPDQWEVKGLNGKLISQFGFDLEAEAWTRGR